MNPFVNLMQRQPLILFHLLTAIGALLLGLVILSRHKGTDSHRTLGWMWVTLMFCTTLASAFIRDYRLPNLHGYTPIHFFTLYVAVMMPLAVRDVRRGNIVGHRKAMRGIYIGGCVVAGIFTLLPGRFLGSLLWGSPMNGIAS
ncbi:MAG: DUF2306 domain-containing protein [Burkholderiaceae bacterium]|nr:DUF2306 domain-containing protein [Burkholderiaceae bacterium]